MELPSDLVTSMEKLVQNPSFIENMAHFTQTALITLYGLENDEET